VAGDRHRVGRLAEIDAVILAGGLGTRLRPVVGDRPKAIVSVHGRPFLTYLFDQLISAGISRVVLCLGYGSQQIRASIGESYRGLSIVRSEETAPLGTGGALRLALSKLRSDPALVLNGDSYCGAELEEFWLFHRDRRAAASLLLTSVPDTGRFGRVQLGTGSDVIDFQEKGKTSGSGLINAGLYLIDCALIEEIPGGKLRSLEREVFPSWIGRGLYGFASAGKFLDIGTPEAYASAEAFFSDWQRSGAERAAPSAPR